MAHTYAICIYYDSEFYDISFAHKILANEILHQMIRIGMGFSLIRLRKDDFF